MAPIPRRSRVPLPEGWPRRVRSAIIHAVWIARVALSIARAKAENHFDARIPTVAPASRSARPAPDALKSSTTW